jgi:hypothetical protein
MPAYAGMTVFELALRFSSACDAAAGGEAKADKKQKLFERSEFLLFPAFGFTTAENSAVPRSPSFAFFSWRDKKRRWLPGHPQHTRTAAIFALWCRPEGRPTFNLLLCYAPSPARGRRGLNLECHQTKTAPFFRRARFFYYLLQCSAIRILAENKARGRRQYN